MLVLTTRVDEWPKFACWLGSFVIVQGIRTSNFKKPYILVQASSGNDRDSVY